MKQIIWSQLNWLDYTILGIVALSIIISLFRGFVREAISLMTWIVAVVLAVKYSNVLAAMLNQHIQSEIARFWLSFAMIFFCVFVVGSIIGAIISAVTSKAGLGFVDRLLGIVFGTLRGIVAVGVVLMLLTVVLAQNNQEGMKQSQLAENFNPLVQWLDAFVPQQAKQVPLLSGQNQY